MLFDPISLNLGNHLQRRSERKASGLKPLPQKLSMLVRCLIHRPSDLSDPGDPVMHSPHRSIAIAHR
ncbi:hypothetical protein LG3211_1781 [Lysobacter gummosus]|nr:hypothetical protein LG3211_1781 [Lysobacter gummosus]